MNELQLAIVNKGKSLGWDMSLFDPSKFSAEQMLELFAGKLSGIDITKYLIPDMPVETMESIRLEMAKDLNYSITDEHLELLDSISPDTVLIKSFINEVSSFMSETSKSALTLNKSLDTIEEVDAIEITEKVRDFITIEFIGDKQALITTPEGRFMYRTRTTSEYIIFKNIGLISLKIKKEEVK